MEHLALGLVLLVRTPATSTLLCQQDLNRIKMDMAPTSFDDRYQGCTSMMEEKLAELNRTEFNNNRVYAKAWTKAAKEWWNKHSHGHHTFALRSEQAIALLVYTYNSPRYKKFNEAVRMAGSSHECYLDNFHFKVLRFLLTEALRALRDARPCCCYNVYRGVQDMFTAQQHQSVHFGQFTSSSLQNKNAVKFGNKTLFSVKTCYGVPIKNYSYYPTEKEVLIRPFESFKVTKVIHDRNRSFIELHSQAAKSNYNCEFVKGSSISEEPPVPLAAAGSP